MKSAGGTQIRGIGVSSRPMVTVGDVYGFLGERIVISVGLPGSMRARISLRNSDLWSAQKSINSWDPIESLQRPLQPNRLLSTSVVRREL